MKELPEALRAWFPDTGDDTTPHSDPSGPDPGGPPLGESDEEARPGPAHPREPAAAADGRPARSRRALLVIGGAAVVLWSSVVVGAVAAPARPGDQAAPAVQIASSPPAHADVAAPAPATATAVLAVHDAVAGERRWVDAAAVEDVTTLRLPDGADVPDDVRDAVGRHDVLPTLFVVAVQASVLEGDGTAWEARRRARYAVPVWCSERRCVEAAAPWPLRVPSPPADDDGPSAPAPTPHDAAGSDGYTAALSAAGYRQIDVRSTRALWRGTTAARVRARAPGEAARREFVIWLADRGGDGTPVPPAVLGDPG